MKLSETTLLLRQIATLDNRKVNDEVIAAWHDVIGQLPFDIAKEALRLAQQDSTVKYLEPRHIISWSKEASFRMNREMPEDLLVTASDPAPVCEHGKSLPLCLPCCRDVSKSLG